MATIPEGMKDLLSREKKAFAVMALARPNGTVQATPVWFDWDGHHIIVNTARGRVKDRLMAKKAHITMVILDPENPYRYLQIQGHISSETEEGGYDMICRLNEKYHGKFEYPKRPGEVRVTYTITPDRVSPTQG